MTSAERRLLVTLAEIQIEMFENRERVLPATFSADATLRLKEALTLLEQGDHQ